MKELFNTKETKIIIPKWLGNIVYNHLSEKFICKGETNEGWVYQKQETI